MFLHVGKIENFYKFIKGMFLLVRFFYKKILRLAFTFACSKVKINLNEIIKH